MPATARNPAVFPAFVAQHSVTFDPDDLIPLGIQYPGLGLPASLERAVAKRRAEFLAGRFCVRAALRVCAPDVADHVPAIGPHREPLWPSGIVGAITHTDGFASAAVARTAVARAVGLDTERIMAHHEADGVTDKIASRDELARIVRATGWPDGVALTAIFSAKEAIFKCLYPEVRAYFDFVDAQVDAFEDGQFHAHLTASLTPSLPAGHALRGRYELEGDRVSSGIVLAVGDAP